MRSRLTAWLLPLAAVLGLWDIAPFLFRRASEDPDQGWIHLALLAGILLWWWPRQQSEIRHPRCALLCAAVLVINGGLALTVPYPLIRSLAAAGALALGLLSTLPHALRSAPALIGCCLLLPFSEETASYLIGFPSRILAAGMAGGILRFAGFTVAREGAVLEVNGTALFVDAPCAGLHMGWTGLAIAGLMCLYRGTGVRRTAGVFTAAVGLILLGNAVRMTLLAQLESLITGSPPAILHNTVGIVSFLMLLPVLAWLSNPGPPSPAPQPTTKPAKRRLTPWVVSSAMFCLLAPLAGRSLSPSNTEPSSATQPADWPDTWRGMPLTRIPLTDVDERFASNFPGSLARFETGVHSILFRFLRAPSRAMHAGAVCYQANGFDIQPQPGWRDDQSTLWSAYRATKDGQTLLIREQIHSVSTSKTWPDVSSWYWDALLNRDPGPWIAVTVAKSTPAP